MSNTFVFIWVSMPPPPCSHMGGGMLSFYNQVFSKGEWNSIEALSSCMFPLIPHILPGKILALTKRRNSAKMDLLMWRMETLHESESGWLSPGASHHFFDGWPPLMKSQTGASGCCGATDGSRLGNISRPSFCQREMQAAIRGGWGRGGCRSSG